jgi:hypothetical protein
MADEREEDMLELMQDVTRKLHQLQNTINEMWAEWTRIHKPTINRSDPLKKVAPDKPRRQVVRRG